MVFDDELEDGHIVQDGLKHRPRNYNPAEALKYVPFPMQGIILDVYYADEEANRDGESVLADVHITDWGLDFTKVPVLLDKADYDNYIYFTPVPSTKNLDGSQFDKIRLTPAVNDGTTVMVQFINGNITRPVITKVFPHNLSGDSGNKPQSPSPRPGIDEGDCFKLRMNGTNLFFDKDGNVTIENTDTTDKSIPKNKKLKFTFQAPGKTQKVELELDNSGSGLAAIRAISQAGKVQEVKLDAGANTMTVTSDQQTVTMSPSGVAVNVTGNATVQASGNINATAGGNIVAQGSQIQLNGSAGQVLTTVTDPVIDLITGAPTTGVPTVFAG